MSHEFDVPIPEGSVLVAKTRIHRCYVTPRLTLIGQQIRGGRTVELSKDDSRKYAAEILADGHDIVADGMAKLEEVSEQF